MKTKQTLVDLFTNVELLRQKYDITTFSQRSDEILKELNMGTAIIESMMKNPQVLMQNRQEEEEPIRVTPEALETNLAAFADLKKEYKYDDFVREGHRMRTKFMLERKDYPFSKSKFIVYTGQQRLQPLDKLTLDYAEQYMIARWVDRALRKIAPGTLTITHENLKGEMITANYKKREIVLDADYVIAPPINRFVGKTVFDSFLMHGFLNADTNEYEYVPCRLISRIINTSTGKTVELS